LDESVAWAVGNSGTILHTSDGGSTWNPIVVPTLANLNAVFFPDRNHGWIVGDSGIVLQYQYGTIASVQEPINQPSSEFLFTNYPNPFNPSTTIVYDLPLETFVSLQSFDELGRFVETVYEGQQTKGIHRVHWRPRGFSSGVYYLRISTKVGSQTKRILLLR